MSAAPTTRPLCAPLGNGVVSVAEIVGGVAAALGDGPICAVDANRKGIVEIQLMRDWIAQGAKP